MHTKLKDIHANTPDFYLCYRHQNTWNQYAWRVKACSSFLQLITPMTCTAYNMLVDIHSGGIVWFFPPPRLPPRRNPRVFLAIPFSRHNVMQNSQNNAVYHSFPPRRHFPHMCLILIPLPPPARPPLRPYCAFWLTAVLLAYNMRLIFRFVLLSLASTLSVRSESRSIDCVCALSDWPISCMCVYVRVSIGTYTQAHTRTHKSKSTWHARTSLSICAPCFCLTHWRAATCKTIWYWLNRFQRFFVLLSRWNECQIFGKWQYTATCKIN